MPLLAPRMGLENEVTEIGNLENKLLDEIHGMREDFREVSQAVTALTVKVEYLVEGQNETKGHGERIRGLEERVNSIEKNMQSAATERRWIIGVLVASAVAIIIALVQSFAHVGK